MAQRDQGFVGRPTAYCPTSGSGSRASRVFPFQLFAAARRLAHVFGPLKNGPCLVLV